MATVQALSGTGSLQMIAQFMKFMGVSKVPGVAFESFSSAMELRKQITLYNLKLFPLQS